MGQDIIICNLLTEDKSKVLRNTSIGRKRKLSLYRSKKDVQNIKQRKRLNISTEGITPNYTKIQDANSTIDVDILNESNDENKEEFLESYSGDDFSEKGNVSESVGNSNTEDIDEITDFKENCVKKLQDDRIVRKLVDNLDAEGNLYDFVMHIEQLASGELPANNIVLLLLLDRVRFQNSGNTVGMRYRKVTKLFWSVVYRLCKGVGLKFFGGEKNWGQVVNKKSEKSKYSPDKSKINFAVPDEKVLRDLGRVLPKIIPPGKIQCTMDLLRGKDDIILMGDAKLVTKGLKTDFCGDVNLFGHEQNPNLQQLKNYLDKRIEFISDSIWKI